MHVSLVQRVCLKRFHVFKGMLQDTDSDAIVMMYSMICKDCSMNAVAMVSFLPLKCVILFSLLSTAFRVHFEVCATKYKHFCNRLWHYLL